MATEINDWNDLDNIRNDLSGSYKLVSDIDEKSSGYDNVASMNANGGSGWDSIGTSSNPFTGTFDGQGHEVKGLYADRTSDRVALFGKVDSSGIVKNLKLLGFDITSTGISIAGIVGFLNSGTVENCVASGQIQASNNYVGGICGYSNDTIRNCVARGSVTNTGNDTDGATNTGGVLGLMNGGNIRQCTGAADVYNNGNNAFGSVVGRATAGEVLECISFNCTIKGGTGAGILGSGDGVPIRRCFAATNLDNPTKDGGQSPILGFAINYSQSDVSNNYYDENVTGYSDSTAVRTPLTTTEATGNNAYSNMSGISFSKQYRLISAGKNVNQYYISKDGYPITRGADSGEQLISQGMKTFSVKINGSEAKNVSINQKKGVKAEINGNKLPKTTKTQTVFINQKLYSLPELNLLKNPDLQSFPYEPKAEISDDGELIAMAAREGDADLRIYNFPSFTTLPSSPIQQSSNSNLNYIEWSNDTNKLIWSETAEFTVYNIKDWSEDYSNSEGSVTVGWSSPDDYVAGGSTSSSNEAVRDVNNNYSQVFEMGSIAAGDDVAVPPGTNTFYYTSLFQNDSGDYVDYLRKYDADSDTDTLLDQFGTTDTRSRIEASPTESLIAVVQDPSDDLIVIDTSSDTEIAESPLENVNDALSGEVKFSKDGKYLIYSESGDVTKVYDTSTWNVVSSINEGDQHGLTTGPKMEI